MDARLARQTFFGRLAGRLANWVPGQIAERTLAEISNDRIPSVAAGVTFFALLAIFPALASIVSLYGMFADRESVAEVIEHVDRYLPGGAVTVLETELNRLIAQPAAKLNFTFVVGFLIAVWSASGGVKALIDGLNVAYETKERRGFVQLTGMALFFTLSAIILATGIAALAAVVPVLLHDVHLLRPLSGLFAILKVPLVYLICVLILDLVYRLGPDRRHEDFEWISWGSGIGAALWILVTILFGWYVQNFGSYDRVYGNLGAAVGFLTWIWIMLVILLAGAELNCEVARRRRSRSSEHI